MRTVLNDWRQVDVCQRIGLRQVPHKDFAFAPEHKGRLVHIELKAKRLRGKVRVGLEGPPTVSLLGGLVARDAAKGVRLTL